MDHLNWNGGHPQAKGNMANVSLLHQYADSFFSKNLQPFTFCVPYQPSSDEITWKHTIYICLYYTVLLLLSFVVESHSKALDNLDD